MERFSSFDEAWCWFEAGGELQPVADWQGDFTAGRAQFISFIAPVTDDAVLARAHETLDELASHDLTPVRDEDLHITLRGVGFQVIERTRPDEVLRQEVGRIGDTAARLLRGQPPIEVAIGPVNVFPDALVLEVRDAALLAALRTRLAEASPNADALGIDDGTYLPHVTIATFGSAAASEPLRQRLPALRALPPTPLTVRRIEFARHWFTGLEAEPPERDVIRSYVLRPSASER